MISTPQIELFAALGNELRHFGEDADTRRLTEEACRANAWFSPTEVVRAMSALGEEMLQEDALRRWLSAYRLPVEKPLDILVVMAGNIPAVGFFDLLCVICAGHRCLYKPSAKDAVLIEALVARLKQMDPDCLLERYTEGQSVDAVIATGSDNAERYFRAHYAGRPMLLRGSRQSVAVLSGHESDEQLKELADDIWTYSGMGCRNVSLIFAPEDCQVRLEIPQVNAKYISNYRQRKALLKMTGRAYVDLGAALLVEGSEFPHALSEITICRYRNVDEIAAWIERHDREIQCVVTEVLPHARRVDFGRAQSPTLYDWPDGRDVLRWLESLNDSVAE